MDVLNTVGLVVVPLLAASAALRVWVRPVVRGVDWFSAFFWSAAAIGIGLDDGPGWLLVTGGVTAGLTLLAPLTVLIGALVRKPLIEVEPDEFRGRLLAACTAPDPPPAVLIGVGPDGTLTVWGLEAAGFPRNRHRTGSACAMCLLESVVEELADDGPAAVAEYRAHLRRRANQLFLLRHGTISGRWTADLRPVKGLNSPYPTPPCTVHRP